MNPVSITAFVLMLGAAGVAAWYPGQDPEIAPDAGPAAPPRGVSILAGFFGFFGIGRVPARLALAVLLGTGAVAALTLDVIAGLHLGHAYPAWFPIDAVASGLGVGLLSTRMLAASYPDDHGI